MANLNGRPAALNGSANRNVRVATNGAGGGPKVDPNDPQVRKLVYNMYRGMLGQQHQQANLIVDNAPQEQVAIDAGVGARVESMMRQQCQLKGGGMNTTGTPPPPPPPPIPSVLPSSRLPTEISARAPVMNPPAALAGAMLKDKKPFTYTPGGIDLSEINSPNQNGGDQGDLMAPVQSRSFRVLQNVLSQDGTDVPSNGTPMKVEVPLGSGSPSTHTRGSQMNSGNKATLQRGSISQPNNSQRGPVSLANMGQRGSVSSAGNPISQLKNNSEQQQNCGFRVIPIQQDVKITPKMGGFKTNGSGGNELSSIFRNQVQVSTDSDEARSRGGYFPQRTVVVTQSCEPQGPVHIPNLVQQQKPSPQQQPAQYQPSTHYQPPTLYQQQGSVTSSAPSEDAPPEPKKYMGGSIPSRSFKMLQALTSTDDASDNGVPANGSEASHPPDSDTQHAGSQIPSPAWKTYTQSSPPSLSPSSTLTTTNDSSSDSGIFSSSKVSPSYTTTDDSKVYRNVAPKVTINKSKREHVVNSALSHTKEPTSPFSQSISSPTWKNSHAPKFFSSHTTPTVVKSTESNGQNPDQECPRLMKIVRQESSSSQNSQEGTERRYEGGHIPSRVFRHLQTEYPDSPADNHEVKPQGNSNVQPPHFEVKAIPPRVVKSFQTSGFESDKSNSCEEPDDYCSNGMSRTAAHKNIVLNELTSQFENMGTMKKPKAAPGKVFRHLQDQYDTPVDDQHEEVHQHQTEDVHNFGYRGSKLPSPSFRFLQNQYHQQEKPEETFYEDAQVHNAPEYEHEPLPYQGARLPGRTFRSIQDNMGAHPSVIKPRK